jgi:hypothetical protein
MNGGDGDAPTGMPPTVRRSSVPTVAELRRLQWVERCCQSLLRTWAERANEAQYAMYQATYTECGRELADVLTASLDPSKTTPPAGGPRMEMAEDTAEDIGDALDGIERRITRIRTAVQEASRTPVVEPYRGNERDALIRRAIEAGKTPQAMWEQWRTLWNASPAETQAILEALAEG